MPPGALKKFVAEVTKMEKEGKAKKAKPKAEPKKLKPEKKPKKEKAVKKEKKPKMKIPEGALKRLGPKVKVEEEEAVVPEPEAVPEIPAEPKIDISGKAVADILLELGEVPHYMIAKNPEWAEMPEADIISDVGMMDDKMLLPISDYYNRLEELGDLNENEKIAAKAMRDRIWDEEIGEASIDLIELTPEDMETLSNMTLTLIDKSKIDPITASNSQIAEGLYVRMGGPLSAEQYKTSPFGPKAIEPHPMKGEFEVAANEDGKIVAVRSRALSKKDLWKRLLFETNIVPIVEIKKRRELAEEWKEKIAEYFPPEFEELQGYYRPEWDEMSLLDAQRELARLSPDDLLNTYKMYYMMRFKEMLTKTEEHLVGEMERLLNKLQEHKLIKVTIPEVRPPELRPKPEVITDETFAAFVDVLNRWFIELPAEVVDEFATRPESDMALEILKTGEATEEERWGFVKAMDLLLGDLPEKVYKKFEKSPDVNIFDKVAMHYYIEEEG